MCWGGGRETVCRNCLFDVIETALSWISGPYLPLLAAHYLHRTLYSERRSCELNVLICVSAVNVIAETSFSVSGCGRIVVFAERLRRALVGKSQRQEH